MLLLLLVAFVCARKHMINGVGEEVVCFWFFVFMPLTQRAAVSSYNKGPQEWPALGTQGRTEKHVQSTNRMLVFSIKGS